VKQAEELKLQSCKYRGEENLELQLALWASNSQNLLASGLKNSPKPLFVKKKQRKSHALEVVM